MDIFSFIESKDIAQHIKATGYRITDIQKAWLVWNCRSATQEERHAAWQELIQSTTDQKIVSGLHSTEWPSFHQMLADYMALDRKLVDLLKRDDPNTVFRFEAKTNSLNPRVRQLEWRGEALFSTYEKALSGIEDWDNPPFFRITKHWCDTNFRVEGTFNAECQLLEIDCYGELITNYLNEQEIELHCESFDGMWFDIPIPFQKGDLVQDTQSKEPFVLLDTDPWAKQRHPNRGSHRCASDMLAFGYSYDPEDHFLYDDYMCGYLNLEYCTDPLVGGERLLEAYSRFVKGEIDAWSLSKFARMYHCEELAELDRKQLKSFGAVK